MLEILFFLIIYLFIFFFLICFFLNILIFLIKLRELFKVMYYKQDKKFFLKKNELKQRTSLIYIEFDS